jgi:hypothetical protein
MRSVPGTYVGTEILGGRLLATVTDNTLETVGWEMASHTKESV